MRHRSSIICIVLSILVISAGWEAPSALRAQDQLNRNQEPKYQVQAFFDAASKWRSSSIAVCWENPPSPISDEMIMVRKAIASTWEAASSLRFTGWQKCVDNNKGIRILIDDSGPRTKELGNRLNGVRAGMILNFTFNNWSGDCKSMRDYCIKTIAIHEFGHAIGFAHEQNRSDAPGECQDLRQGSDGTKLLTPYDPSSVMNYCNPKYNNDGILSKLDKEAVMAMYPPTIPETKKRKTSTEPIRPEGGNRRP